MKIKALKPYRNAKGTMVFPYMVVSGTPKELAAFKAAQGTNYREGNREGTPEFGKPIWFTTRFIGDTSTLAVSEKGKIYADTSQLDKAASLAAQYGGNLGQELARQSAALLLGGGSVNAEVAVTEPADLSKA